MNDLSAVLKRIRQTRPNDQAADRPRPGERCELCTVLIPDEHGHVVDLESRALMCACRSCYLVFSPDGAGGNRFRAVPDRYVAFGGVGDVAVWDGLEIPVGVAFFFYNSLVDQLAAFYPGPAGATESLLPLDAWKEIVAVSPELATLRPDVEALLLRTADASREDHAEAECFIVPIDVCYELVGELRRLWRGFDGGTEAHVAMRAFFDRVRTRARAGAHA